MKLRKYRGLVTVAFASAFCWSTASAELAIVVNPGNANKISDSDVKRIFLGKTKSFPDGSRVLPVDQQDNEKDRDSFYNKVIGKNASQLKSYWSTMIFSGKGTPPKEVGMPKDVKALVSSNPAAIGYIDKSLADNTVKIVFTVK